MTLPTLHTTAEVCDALQVSRYWLAKHVHAGLIRPAKISSDGRRWRFTDADVERLLEALRPAPVAAVARRRRRST